MDRRQFLAGAGLGLLAGCLGSGGETATPGDASGDESAATAEPATATATATTTATQRDTDSPTPTAPIEEFEPYYVKGYEIRPRDVVLAREMESENGYSETPDAGQLFLFVRVEVRNTTEGSVAGLSRGDWALVAENSQFAPASGTFTSALPNPVSPVDGEWYSSPGEILAGVTVSGWLRFAVPDTAERAELVIDSDPAAYGEDGFSERWRMRLPSGELPNLQPPTVSAPESVEIGETIEYEVTIENSGGSAATETYEYTFGEGYTQDTYEFEVSVPAGEQVTKTINGTTSSSGEVVFGIAGETYTTSVIAPVRSFGNAAEFAEGLEIAADVVEFADEYATGIDVESDYSDPKGAPDGFTFAFVELTVEATTSESPPTPDYDGFVAIVDGESYGTVYDVDGALERPVEGEFYSGPRLDVGEQVTEWVVLEVPDETNRSSMAVSLDQESVFNSFDATWQADVSGSE